MSFERFLPYVAFMGVFLILGAWSARRRQYVLISSQSSMNKAGIISRYIIVFPIFCWVLTSWLLLIALADPIISSAKSTLTVEGKEAIICVDTSTSMGKEVGAKGKSAMENIKNMLHDFIERRLAKGDIVGVSAFGGRSRLHREFGNARIIQYPTQDNAILYSSVDVLEPTMFGALTAIGDGIFISIIALIEPQLKKVLKEDYDRNRFENAVWNIGKRTQDPEYLNTIIAAAGQQRGRYIVLFTDGIYNTGLKPYRALWLASRLGLKVHFIAFESTAATGVIHYEGLRRQLETVKAAIKTGGLYRESRDIEGIAEFFMEVDQAEKIQLIISEEFRGESRKRFILYCASAVFGLWMISWLLWSDPL